MSTRARNGPMKETDNPVGVGLLCAAAGTQRDADTDLGSNTEGTGHQGMVYVAQAFRNLTINNTDDHTKTVITWPGYGVSDHQSTVS